MRKLYPVTQEMLHSEPRTLSPRPLISSWFALPSVLRASLTPLPLVVGAPALRALVIPTRICLCSPVVVGPPAGVVGALVRVL